MSREELVGVMVRLFALGIVLYVLSRAPVLGILFSQALDLRGMVFSGGLFLILLLLGGLFWFFPLSIARLLLPTRTNTPVPSHWTPEELLGVGMVLVGIFLGFHAISDAVSWTMLWLFNSRNSLTWQAGPHELAGMIATGVKAALALGLVFGAQGLAGSIWRLRNAGTRRPAQPSAEGEG